MKKHVAMKWVKALRSGKYEQEVEKLQSSSGYCCLGVLCEISPKSIHKKRNGGILLGTELLNQPEVLKWSGFKSSIGYLPDKSKLQSLADLNDNKNLNFKQIAEIIEKYWRYL